MQHEWYVSQSFTAISMLLHDNTILTYFYWHFHVCDLSQPVKYWINLTAAMGIFVWADMGCETGMVLAP